MKKTIDNRYLNQLFAALSMIFAPITKHVHRRDVLVALIGALLALIAARTTLSNSELVFPEEPTEVILASVEPMSATPEVAVTNDEAANIARVLYGVRDYQLSENAKLAIIETIFSRVECSYGEFGDTINDVCLKPMQWQGFVADSSYLKEDYDLALSYINGNHQARITPEGCYWFVVDNDGVTVRSKFDGGNSWIVG